MTILGPGDIVGLVNSTYATDLFVAVVAEFDIFTRLAERDATTARQLAEALGTDERATDVTLTYLAALGLLERLPDGAVRATETATQYLSAGTRVDLRHYARTVVNRPGCREAIEVLRTGRPAPWEGEDDDWLNRMSDNDFADSFSAAMNARGAYLSPALGEVLRDLARPSAQEPGDAGQSPVPGRGESGQPTVPGQGEFGQSVVPGPGDPGVSAAAESAAPTDPNRPPASGSEVLSASVRPQATGSAALADQNRPPAPGIQPTEADRQNAPTEDPHQLVVPTREVVHSVHDTTPVDQAPSVDWQAGSPLGVAGDAYAVAARRILDIGGSSGVYACSLVEALPGTTAAVLDLPSVVDFTRESIAARGLSDRVDVIGGDMFGDLPRGFDVHLYSNVWHDWDVESIGKLAAASFAVLPPGGVLVDHDMHLDDTKSGPLRQAEFSVRMMLMTKGKCYSTPELAEILHPIGFEDIHLRPTTAGYSVVIARKPAL